MKKGLPVSAGVAVARAYCLSDGLTEEEPHYLDEADLSGEVRRFTAACAAAAQELDGLIARVESEVGESEAGIFRAHRALLRDPALVARVKNAILTRHVDARTALQEALDQYAQLFAQIEDAYLRERMTDIRDVVTRILTHLSVQETPMPAQGADPLILVAAEILPSQAASFDRMRLAGIVTEKGGSTGHAAILARSLGVPAVSGLRGILKEVHTGDLLALDGREGYVYVNPGAEVEAAYRKLQREYVDLRDRLIENREQEPITPDGIHVDLFANVNGPADSAMAAKVGAGGIGLYRTEYLFLTHASVPTEEEQVAVYRQVIESAPNQNVTIRTLDLGGDKQVPYLGNPREANPFMGWRSIRLSVAHPEFFQTQVRAILRAGLHGCARLLFPMISTLEEVRQLKRMVHRTRLSLERAGIPFAEDIPLGIMLEVPSAALCIDHLLDEVDFVSIGSNDLTQYLMAADRDNPKVAHLCEPFGPAIFKTLDHIIRACNKHGKPVTLCGEMAGRPRCLLPLLGMGLRSLSMSPGFVPAIKELVRHTPLSVAEETARRVLSMKTFAEIRGYLSRQVRQVSPNVAMLDVRK
jgi:phosphoenolpyruvate-protein phosphotransferase